VILTFDGQLEIDQDRGVIYFHSNEGVTLLRICSLPKPIPHPLKWKFGDTPRTLNDYLPLDITHMHGTSWGK